MNNKIASMIRNFGMNHIFNGVDVADLVQIDSGKFVFPIDTGNGEFWCEVDFIAKKESYTPDRDVRLYNEKLVKASEREADKAAKKAAREAVHEAKKNIVKAD